MKERERRWGPAVASVMLLAASYCLCSSVITCQIDDSPDSSAFYCCTNEVCDISAPSQVAAPPSSNTHVFVRPTTRIGRCHSHLPRCAPPKGHATELQRWWTCTTNSLRFPFLTKMSLGPDSFLNDMIYHSNALM